MLSIKQKMIGLNLYCGGALAAAPESGSDGDGGVVKRPSEGGAPAAPAAAGLWAPSEGAQALIGGGSRAGAPPALIGPFEGAQRSLIGWPCRAPPRPSALPLAEEELDGCEEPAAGAEGDGAPGPLVPSPTASVSEEDEEPEEMEPLPGPAGGDVLRAETLELVLRYFVEVAAAAEGNSSTSIAKAPGRGAPPSSSSPRVARALETLHRVGDGIHEKHQLAFQGMLKKLNIKNKDDLKSISEVATHVFSDDITNWGRIVTLISFGAFVAKHLQSINQENNIIPLAEIITDVLVIDKREWLVRHSSWDGFVEFFHVEDIEGNIRKVLMAFASVAGIGAGLAYMIR